jgi:hypothetical protein
MDGFLRSRPGYGRGDQEDNKDDDDDSYESERTRQGVIAKSSAKRGATKQSPETEMATPFALYTMAVQGFGLAKTE